MSLASTNVNEKVTSLVKCLVGFSVLLKLPKNLQKPNGSSHNYLIPGLDQLFNFDFLLCFLAERRMNRNGPEVTKNPLFFPSLLQKIKDTKGDSSFE